VCDIIPERAEAAKVKYGAQKTTLDYRDIVADPDIDAVSVCVHNWLHAPLSIDLLNAGKNVLCEKPASVSYKLMQDMQQAAETSHRILNIGVVNRFNTAVNRVKDMIDGGELGKLYHVYCSFRSHRSIPGLGGQFTTKATAGGGVLIDWGVHFIDLIMYCLGVPAPLSVSGQAHSVLGKDMEKYVFTDMWAGPPDYSGTYDVEDFITGFVRTEGPTITLNGAWAQNIGESAMFIEFMGDKGGIKLQYGGGFTFYTTKNGMLVEEKPTFQTKDMFATELDMFLASSATGEKNRGNIDHVMATGRIMDGLYQSSTEGREINFK
jgi:predicted dehydrogenase